MEDVNTFVVIQLVATIACVLLVIPLMTMITVAQVRSHTYSQVIVIGGNV